jgi:hypothetical protein
MRMSGFLFAILFVACFNPTHVYAQSDEERPAADEQTQPYHKHRDTRHGHDHVYPDRGAIVRNVPSSAFVVNYAGLSYRFHGGVWFEPRGPAFMVVGPPIGVIVPTLPSFATPVAHGGEAYLYVNEVFYRSRPELGGYEVVNDPGQVMPFDRSGGFVGAAPSTAPTAQTSAALVASPVTASSTVSAAPAATIPAPTPAPALPASAATPIQMASLATRTAAPTTPPAGPSSFQPPPPQTGTSTLQMGTKVLVYPRNGQTADQQARDRYDCYRFAVAQSGFDPMHPAGIAQQTPHAEPSDYARAQEACLEGRGYTIR